ncbi:hypothetical protein TSAR_004836 [Trichomalopsis sarcophagae]|uniref:Uncharacterized protein n=1 Tax=Trichomalopsis sarcophagae TaxID=543379 RepID=A0A232EDZ8_9HYME|nr:hypothetical protein TSAR_004836 [Trichomalopsis sarcophagae]
MDGAPLNESSEKNVWPILASDRIIDDVYVIGVYAVCDAPAKAFVLNVKYHSGYNCCSKCKIEGIMFRSVCFPGEISILRTDEEFRNNAYMGDYQRSETILNRIPRLGLVTGVPLDPMHLIYLGCSRFIILQNQVSSDVYMNFVTLHVAIRILSNPLLCKNELYLNYAEDLLKTFVKHFQKLYGPQFENSIRFLKGLIRKGDQPLQQLMRRSTEIERVRTQIIDSSNRDNVRLSQRHDQGPLLHDITNVVQYKCAEFRNFKINCLDSKNSCLQIDKQYIMIAENFTEYTNGEVQKWKSIGEIMFRNYVACITPAHN